MKITAEIPDDLHRRAKAKAALRGCKLDDLVDEGLRLVLDASAETRPKPRLADLMKPGRAIVDSGLPDLGSNPRHLEGFGRDARRRR